jgi:ketosteroid isomerase-like protein
MSRKKRSPSSGGRPLYGYRRAVDASEAVLAANRHYYEAFEARDLDAMSDVWEHSDRVLCTHPGWATLEGWGPVAASYFALFQGGQQLQFVLTRERAAVAGETAWVSLDENLLGDQGGVTVATINIFVLDEIYGRWRMVCHHGSVVQATPPARRTAGS